MKLSIPAGTTSKRIAIFVQDSSSTTGAGLTGLAFNSSGLTCYSWIDTDGNAGGTSQALQTATRGTWTTRGFVEKDATNMPGFYEFGVPDALLAAGVKWATLLFKGVTNMAPVPIEIEVTAVSNQDGVRGGLTALPNATAGANGGLPLGDASGRVDIGKLLGTAWLTPGTAGTPDVNVKLWNALATVALPLIPTTAGRTLDVSAGGEAGVDWANVGSPTTANGLTGTTIATSQVVASVTGAVGSVTGAVGSVTGAVGSVTGAVGSVTGAVGSLTTNNDKTGYALTSGERTSIADAMLDETNGVETSLTPRQALRLMLAALAGKLSGAATTTVTIRNVGDSKNRIVATVDSDGNRSAVTTDGT